MSRINRVTGVAAARRRIAAARRQLPPRSELTPGQLRSRLRRPTPAPAGPDGPPLVSIVVIVYDMPRQAMNTLFSLSRRYQRDIDDVPYEVIVVENRSGNDLKRAAVERLGPEFRYLPRDEPGVSPVHAINEGIAAARADIIGVMIDGARMVTPGVLRNTVDAFRAYPDAVVAAPGFHLGFNDHQDSAAAGWDERAERHLLAGTRWKQDGYELYTVATLSKASPFGYLHPMMESNCMFATRSALTEIGGADPRFDQPGGGVLNPDMYWELLDLPRSQLVILAGEASFHQFHGGVTTQHDRTREPLMQQFQERYEEVRGRPFRAPLREPVLFGAVHAYAAPLLHYSAIMGRNRFERRVRGIIPTTWDDDPVVPSLELLENPFGVDKPGGHDMSIYLPPSVRHFYPRHLVFSTWADHIQFGYDLVAAQKPELLVELGTQGGLSYFAFCQSVQENDLSTTCYAVDTWEGEEHTGKYDESTWELVSDVNRLSYSGFSYLMRMYFKEALDHFEDESIDLLHIDGLHTYDAVAEDFTTWYPKVKPGGIILFHDIKARMKDFGVWRFWDELMDEHEQAFEFRHGFGLGVLRKPGPELGDEQLLQLLFNSTPGEQEQLRQFYVHAAQFHDFRRRATGKN